MKNELEILERIKQLENKIETDKQTHKSYFNQVAHKMAELYFNSMMEKQFQVNVLNWVLDKNTKGDE